MIGTELSKQKALNVNSKAKQQISFTGNQNRAAGATMFLAIKESKEAL